MPRPAESFDILILPPARPRARLGRASVVAQSDRRPLSRHCATAVRICVYELREAALEAVAPPGRAHEARAASSDCSCVRVNASVSS
jgi:hypothetical protein